MWHHSLFRLRSQGMFKGGVHPHEHKSLTATRPIEHFSSPQMVVLALSQHMGEPSLPQVSRGDEVKRGELIASAQGMGAPLHATVSGKVVRVANAPHPTWVECPSIVIKTHPPIEGEDHRAHDDTAHDDTAYDDSAYDDTVFPLDEQWKSLSPSDMIQRIRDAGVVGLGGATFPTYRKLMLPENVSVDTLIINGAECEPYLTSDHRLMLESASAIIQGAWLLSKILGVKRCLFGIEDNKLDAATHMQVLIDKYRPELSSAYPVEMGVHVTHTRYPQGSEKQLVYVLTGRQIPQKALPLHVGVVVQNVATAAACFEAVAHKKPLLDRVVTLSGGAIREPKNVRVPIGTPLTELIEFCGGTTDRLIKIIHGGPMMGRAIASMDMPVIKGTNGVLFLTDQETYVGRYDACVQCGKCLEVCPLGLEPNRISILVEAVRPLDTQRYGTDECFECGCCSFACPSRRPLVQFIQVSKAAYRRERARLALATTQGARHV